MIIKLGFTIPNGLDFEQTLAYKYYEEVLRDNNNKYEFKKAIVKGAGVGRNRNLCVTNGKSSLMYQSNFDFDYMLFVDFDIEFNYSHIEQLISRDKDIITGAYNYKDNYTKIHAGSWGDKPGILGENLPYEKDGIKKIDRCGGGFLLIKSDVFKKLPYPWFNHRMIEIKTQNGTAREETSEDFGFCILAKENDLDVFCDTDCLLVHHRDSVGSSFIEDKIFSYNTAEKALKFLNRTKLKGKEVSDWIEVHNVLNSFLEK